MVEVHRHDDSTVSERQSVGTASPTSASAPTSSSSERDEPQNTGTVTKFNVEKRWELREDSYGVLVYVNGVRATYKPKEKGGQSRGFYGCVIEAKVTGRLREIQILFAENTVARRSLDNFRDSLGLSASMSAAEFVKNLNERTTRVMAGSGDDSELSLQDGQVVSGNETDDERHHSLKKGSVQSNNGAEKNADVNSSEESPMEETDEGDSDESSVETQMVRGDKENGIRRKGSSKLAKKRKERNNDDGDSSSEETPVVMDKGNNMKGKVPSKRRKQMACESSEVEVRTGDIVILSDGEERNVTQKGKKKTKKETKPLPRAESKETDKMDAKINLKLIGDFKVPVECLCEPPAELMVREVDDDFVQRMTAEYNPKLGFTYTVIPVLVVEGERFDARFPEKSKYFTLGGNHLRKSINKLMTAGVLNKGHQTIWVSVYKDLDQIEALRLGTHHNKATHTTKPTTFLDKVRQARKLLYQTYDINPEDDLPQKKRDGRRMEWRKAFGKAMNETSLSKDKLEKYSTIFHTASLSKECWNIALELMKNKPSTGAGTFKCLQGLGEEDQLHLLAKINSGDLTSCGTQQKEARRLKKLCHLKSALPKLLNQDTWDETLEKYPSLTDETLHSYLALDWTSGTPVTVKTLCTNLQAAKGTGHRLFSHNGVEVNITDQLDDLSEVVLHMEKVVDNEDISVLTERLKERPLVVRTTLYSVSNVIGILEEMNHTWEAVYLCFGDRVEVAIIAAHKPIAKQVLKADTEEEALQNLIEQLTDPLQWVKCNTKETALAALKKGRNVICTDTTGCVEDYVVAWIENTEREKEEEKTSEADRP